ncbi:MAG: hypothetical protein Q4E11_07950 [Corynebacterium sp.]|uniref:hypothetical protein n=1 Tax=Corynebacterium sp. TaxID=1720 RepID=UPI0026DC9E6C|nr:hypothetical protein [Corynebacterium sp.]MDO5030497.1 hypothetical protein [Corynebacterium sp.]
MSDDQGSPEPQSAPSRGRRQRRRAGAPAKNFARKAGKKSASAVTYHDESPEDARGFDADYWASQRPPHWG